MANGRRIAADTYGRNTVELKVNECKENQFIWCPAYVTKVQKEATTVVAKIIRFNKGGVMVRA